MIAAWPSMAAQCPVDHTANSTKCPVDHTKPEKGSESGSTWSKLFAGSSSPQPSSDTLSKQREVSSIPRDSDGHWVYPSEAQFFAAMARKNHNPQAADMKTIVPIHNAVNERAWMEILKWEDGKGAEQCGGLKLVNFKGRPGDRSPKARWKMLMGYVCSRSAEAAQTHSFSATLRHLTDTTGLWTAAV